jgi:hypothetical protein
MVVGTMKEPHLRVPEMGYWQVLGGSQVVQWNWPVMSLK